jgi:hypothetical protein
VSAEETEEGEGMTEGDVCPACGQGVLQAQDDLAGEEAAEGEIDPEETGVDEEDPDAEGEGNPFGGADPDADEDGDGDGVPDEEEEDDEDPDDLPGVPVKSADGPQDDEEDDDGPVKKKPSKPNR